jgi:hypothetical protein
LVSSTIKKIVILFYSSLAGLLVGGTTVTGVIAWMNFTARDGPLFPPALVALVLLAPVMVLLISFEIGVLGYELTTKQDLGKEFFGFGLVGGILPAILLHEILITPYQDELDIIRLLIFLGLGMIIGLAAFGTHWLGNRFWNHLDPS